MPGAHQRHRAALTTLLGGDEAGHLDGYGAIDAATARALALGGTWKRLVTDPLTGAIARPRTHPLPAASRPRRAHPPRDRTCFRPGCGARACGCELDHTHPLRPRRHHLLRQPRPGLQHRPPPQDRRSLPRPPDLARRLRVDLQAHRPHLPPRGGRHHHRRSTRTPASRSHRPMTPHHPSDRAAHSAACTATARASDSRDTRGEPSSPARLTPSAVAQTAAVRVIAVSDLPSRVSETFDPTLWRDVAGFDFTDITYHRGVDRTGAAERDLPVVRIAFDRPEVRNAFRPHTVDELYRALDHARMTSDVAAVILTGNGPSPKDGGWAFCSGGDQRIRGRDGYRYEAEGADDEAPLEQRREQIDPARAGRLHILEVQRLIRTMPKVGHRRGPRLGGRRRAQPQRGLRPLHRLAPARPVHADRRQRRLVRRRVRLGAPGPPGRGQASARDLLPRQGVLGGGRRALGRGQRGRRPRGARDAGPGVRPHHRHEVPAGHPHAEVRLQHGRRRPGRPAGLRRGGHPAWPT